MNLSINLIWVFIRNRKFPDNALNVYQKRNLAMNLPYNRIFDLCLDSMKILPDIIIDTSDRDKGIIIAFYPLFTLCYLDGVDVYTRDKISFSINMVNNHHAHVSISCEPDVSVRIIDGWVDTGRNYQTIEKITAFLKNRQIPDLVISFGEREKCPVCGNE